MLRIDFYHLQNQKLEEVLPKLVEKAYETGKRIKIKIGNVERVEDINSTLWTYNDEAFLPHGTAKDGNAKSQPVFLSADDDNPNEAEILFLVDGAEEKNLESFARVLNIFDGKDPDALANARAFWKELKEKGLELNYWQQESSGSWVKKG